MPTQIKSFGSVKIISLDVDEVLRRLRKAAARLKAHDPSVEAVYLFGSLARGEGLPGSDADLLVVLNENPKTTFERVGDYLEWFSGLGLAVDVFPYTRTELRRLRKSSGFVKEALRHKIKLA